MIICQTKFGHIPDEIIIKKLCNCETKELTCFIYSKQMSNNDGQRMQIVFDYVIHWKR